ncbi:MAG: TIR domain-containing protein [Chitinophagales bacterium]
MRTSIKVYIAYSDIDVAIRDSINSSLKALQRAGIIDKVWDHKLLQAGSNIKSKIINELTNADIILLLLSSDFFASDFCYETQLIKALELHKEESVRVIPILARDCAWNLTPLKNIAPIPKNNISIKSSDNEDKSYTEIAYELEKVVLDIKEKKKIELQKIEFNELIELAENKAALKAWNKAIELFNKALELHYNNWMPLPNTIRKKVALCENELLFEQKLSDGKKHFELQNYVVALEYLQSAYILKGLEEVKVLIEDCEKSLFQVQEDDFKNILHEGNSYFLKNDWARALEKYEEANERFRKGFNVNTDYLINKIHDCQTKIDFIFYITQAEDLYHKKDYENSLKLIDIAFGIRYPIIQKMAYNVRNHLDVMKKVKEATDIGDSFLKEKEWKSALKKYQSASLMFESNIIPLKKEIDKQIKIIKDEIQYSDYLKIANSAYHEKKFKTAIQHASLALKINPLSKEGRMILEQANAQQNQYYSHIEWKPFQSEGKFGFKTENEEIIIEPKFELIYPFFNQFAIVKENKEYKYVSKDTTVKNISLDIINSIKAHKSAVRSLVLSEKGEYFITGSTDGSAKLWNTKGYFLEEYTGSGSIFGACISPHNQFVVTASDDCIARIWKLHSDKELIKELIGHSDKILSVSFSPNGKYIVTASADNTAKIWSNVGEEIATLRGHTSRILCVVFSPNSQYIATGSADKSVKIWHPDGSFFDSIEVHSKPVRCICFNSRSTQLVSVSQDRKLVVWDIKERICVSSFIAHSSTIWSVSISSNDQFLLTASSDQTIKIWDFNKRLIKQIKTNKGTIYSAKFSIDNRLIFIGYQDGTVDIRKYLH